MSPLYRVHSHGTLARSVGARVTYYERGHEISLSEEEAAQLNANCLPGQERVIRVGEDASATIPPTPEPPRSVEIKVSEPGVQTADELRGAGIELAEAGVIGTPRLKTAYEVLGKLAEATGVSVADLTRERDALDGTAEPDPASGTTIADSADVAPDWSTYLAAVSAKEAAEALRGLESPDDVQAALDAESAEGGLRRPLVIRAGNAALKRLRKG